MLKLQKYWLLIAAVPILSAAFAANSWAQYPAQTTEQLSKHVKTQKPQPQKPQSIVEQENQTEESQQSEGTAAAVQDADKLSVSSDENADSADNTPETNSEEPPLELANTDNRQNTRDLEQQYLKLRESIETEDAFSEQLGEDYLDYGMLLRESGQYKEAIKAFVDALHIAKVNNGIYGIEQRPALVALFETHLLMDNPGDYEEVIQRLLWIEEKNPGSANETSFKMQLLLGNQYLDQFLSKPIRGQESIDKLLLARRHLASALRIHGNRPLEEMLMPYGELALISYFESTILPNVDSRSSYPDPMFKSSRRFSPSTAVLPVYFTDAYPRGMAFLNRYLKKAQEEKNIPHTVHALLNLGDYQQLFKKDRRSLSFYREAWKQAQQLPEDHELRKSFEQPAALPDFNYAYNRQLVLPDWETVEIPLQLKISQYGKVQEVISLSEDSELKPHYPRARRITRRKLFRPRIADGGETVPVEDFAYKIRVRKRK